MGTIKTWWNNKTTAERERFMNNVITAGVFVAVGGATIALVRKGKVKDAVNTAKTVSGTFTRYADPTDAPYNVLVTKVCKDGKIHAIFSTKGLVDKDAVVSAMKEFVSTMEDGVNQNIANWQNVSVIEAIL